MGDVNELLSVIFVTSGTRGDRLLFKYPFELQDRNHGLQTKCKKEVRQRQHAITCDVCDQWQHRLCGNTGISREDYLKARKRIIIINFTCRSCKDVQNAEVNTNEMDTTEFDLDILAAVLDTSSVSQMHSTFVQYYLGLNKHQQKRDGNQRKNPYAVRLTEDFNSRRGQITTRKGVLVGLSDNILAILLGVKNLCGQKFNVKIDEVRFVGFPQQLEDASERTGHKISTFNIVFVLQAHTGPWVVSCYQDVASQITVALKHEEKRCRYLSTQAKVMTTIHDEVTSLPEDSFVSPFESILRKSQLAKHLSQIFNSLNEQGVVHLYINNWIEINFCLPHRLHSIQAGNKSAKIQPECMDQYLKALRPYHALLLLQEESSLIESLPVDCTPALHRLIQVANPLRSLQMLALEADLSLFQVFHLVCHLVYWAKAIIIYPLCETNMYVLSPSANTHLSSPLVEVFTKEFPGRSLPFEMSEFSYPTQLRDMHTVLNQQCPQDMKVRIVVWMLQRHLLVQLHTYIYFVPPVQSRRLKNSGETSKLQLVAEDWGLLDGGLQRSPSFSDAASVTSEESYTLSTPGMWVAQLSKSPSTEFTNDSSLMSEEGKAFSVMNESVFINLTSDEKECIMNVPAAKNLDDLRMFARLFPYFSGKNHVEEIMYFENLTRMQLMTLLEKFREVLIFCTYQDSATMFLR